MIRLLNRFKLPGLLFFYLTCPVVAWGQGAYVPARTVTSTVNGLMRGIQATITVCAASTAGLPCAPALASTLFKDSALTQPLANPTTTDALGNYPQMALAAGTYTITETASGFTGFSWQITIACAAGGCTAGPLTVTTLTVTGALNANGGGALNGSFLASLFDNCYTVDGTFYATIQAAINAAPSGGCVYIPPGSYAPTSTISITKPLTVQGLSSNATVITPTAAVTGAAIAINPAAQQQVILKHFNLNMVNVPTIPAITGNNLAAESEIGWGIISQGTIGIDISNASVSRYHDLRIINQTSYGIRDNADGGAEHHYEKIWLINNNVAQAPTTIALFQFNRTTSTDVGGLYMNRVWMIQNNAGGIVTNGLNMTATGAQANAFAQFDDVVTDGISGGDNIVINNFRRVFFGLSHNANAKANQSCAAATVSCFAGISLISTGQIDFSPIALFSSNNRDISLGGGTVDRTTIDHTRLYGSAAVGAAHIWLVTGTALSNLSLDSPDYDTTTVYSNNEAGLIAATPSQFYTRAGLIGMADGGTCSTPGLFFNADTTTGFARTAGGTWNLCASGVSAARVTSTLFNFQVSASPLVAGGVDLGTTALPFGNLWLGTAATNNFKFQPAATAAARTITLADPLQATVALPMTIANGTQALNTASITTATCDAGVAATATGTLSTDKVSWSFNAAPTATNKYGAFLVVYAVPSANTVTFYTCNPSATTSTPTAMSVNWSVERP